MNSNPMSTHNLTPKQWHEKAAQAYEKALNFERNNKKDQFVQMAGEALAYELEAIRILEQPEYEICSSDSGSAIS